MSFRVFHYPIPIIPAVERDDCAINFSSRQELVSSCSSLAGGSQNVAMFIALGLSVDYDLIDHTSMHPIEPGDGGWSLSFECLTTRNEVSVRNRTVGGMFCLPNTMVCRVETKRYDTLGPFIAVRGHRINIT